RLDQLADVARVEPAQVQPSSPRTSCWPDHRLDHQQQHELLLEHDDRPDGDHHDGPPDHDVVDRRHQHHGPADHDHHVLDHDVLELAADPPDADHDLPPHHHDRPHDDEHHGPSDHDHQPADHLHHVVDDDHDLDDEHHDPGLLVQRRDAGAAHLP